MSTMTWESALQGVTPNTGGSLPAGTYRLRPIGGEAKENSGGGISLSLQMEVISGPLQGRKAYHFENFPTDSSDSAKQRMGYILGMIEAFGLPQAQLSQMMAGQPMTVQSVDYLAKYLVQLGRQVKATIRPRRSDPTRMDWAGFMPDDGIEPEPPAQAKTSAPNPGFPGGTPGQPQFGGAPAGVPQGLPPQGQAQSMPLGGFPGSGGTQPTPPPDWAQQPAAQTSYDQQIQAQGGFLQQSQDGSVQPPQQFAGPGQMAQAAQPQAAGMNQFQQPAAAQFPQQGQPPAPQQGGFPGQQFPGQVDPANFPPQGQQPQAGQLPGAQSQQPQAGPAGLPQGGFPQGGQAPQATF